MRHRRRLLATFGLLAILGPSTLLGPAAAHASCAMPPPLAESLREAPLIFVGTVTRTVEQGLWATVSVEEIWRGPDLPAVVEVKGGAGGNVGTSVDRTFQVGTRYLFVPSGDPVTGFSDGACGPTSIWSPEMAALRPAGARGPNGAVEAVEDVGLAGLLGGLVAPLALVGVVSVVLLGIGLLARGRREG